jgi:hypothetical protein
MTAIVYPGRGKVFPYKVQADFESSYLQLPQAMREQYGSALALVRSFAASSSLICTALHISAAQKDRSSRFLNLILRKYEPLTNNAQTQQIVLHASVSLNTHSPILFLHRTNLYPQSEPHELDVIIDSCSLRESAPYSILSIENIFIPEIVSTFTPLLSLLESRLAAVITMQRAKAWIDFLDAQEHLIRGDIHAIPYITLTSDADGVFLQCAPLQKHQVKWLGFEDALILAPEKMIEMNAKGLPHLIKLEFVDRMRLSEQCIPLGRANAKRSDIAQGILRVDYSEDLKAKFDRNGEVDIPLQQGWLTSSVAGDMALVGRQRSRMKELEKQRYVNPFLPMWLFDYKHIRTQENELAGLGQVFDDRMNPVTCTI